MTTFYAYECSGCGHNTLTDKFYKYKVTHCAICGETSRMEYLGAQEIDLKPQKENAFGKKPKAIARRKS